MLSVTKGVLEMLSKDEINTRIIFETSIIEDDNFVALLEKGTGWITPKGVCIACSRYTHLEVFRSFYPELVKAVSDARDTLSEEEYAWTAELAEGDHPEWHAFPTECDDKISDAEYELYSAAYKSGWVRVGSDYSHSFVRINNKNIRKIQRQIHVEGTAEGLRRQSRTIGDLKEATGFEVVKEVKILD